MQIDVGNLAKGYYKVDKEIEAVLGKDEDPGYVVLLYPKTDKNKQFLVCSDCRDYKTKIYFRHRQDDQHHWNKWELLYTVSVP